MRVLELHKIAQSSDTSELIVHVRGRRYSVDVDHILMAMFPVSKVTGRNIETGRIGEFQICSIQFAYSAEEAAVPGLRALFNW